MADLRFDNLHIGGLKKKQVNTGNTTPRPINAAISSQGRISSDKRLSSDSCNGSSSGNGHVTSANCSSSSSHVDTSTPTRPKACPKRFKPSASSTPSVSTDSSVQSKRKKVSTSPTISIPVVPRLKHERQEATLPPLTSPHVSTVSSQHAATSMCVDPNYSIEFGDSDENDDFIMDNIRRRHGSLESRLEETINNENTSVTEDPISTHEDPSDDDLSILNENLNITCPYPGCERRTFDTSLEKCKHVEFFHSACPRLEAIQAKSVEEFHEKTSTNVCNVKVEPIERPLPKPSETPTSSQTLPSSETPTSSQTLPCSQTLSAEDDSMTTSKRVKKPKEPKTPKKMKTQKKTLDILDSPTFNISDKPRRAAVDAMKKITKEKEKEIENGETIKKAIKIDKRRFEEDTADEKLATDAGIFVEKLDVDANGDANVGDASSSDCLKCETCPDTFTLRSQFDVHLPCFRKTNQELILKNQLMNESGDAILDAKHNFVCKHCFLHFSSISKLKNHVECHYGNKFRCRWITDANIKGDANKDSDATRNAKNSQDAKSDATDLNSSTSTEIISQASSSSSYFSAKSSQASSDATIIMQQSSQESSSASKSSVAAPAMKRKRHPICGRLFSTKDAAIQHVIIKHRPDLVSNCNNCKVSFAFKKELRKHRQECNKQSNKNVTSNKSTKKGRRGRTKSASKDKRSIKDQIRSKTATKGSKVSKHVTDSPIPQQDGSASTQPDDIMPVFCVSPSTSSVSPNKSVISVSSGSVSPCKSSVSSISVPKDLPKPPKLRRIQKNLLDEFNGRSIPGYVSNYGVYKCTKCKKSYKTPFEFVAHKVNGIFCRFKLPNGRYVCGQRKLATNGLADGLAPKCKKKFNNEQDLLNHLKEHLDAKVFQCLKCHQFYSDEQIVKRHLETCQS